MNIGFWISTKGGSPLVDGLLRGLAQLGHQCRIWNAGDSYDLILMFNQVSHDVDYSYPQFPDDATAALAFIDTAEYGRESRAGASFIAYTNAFAPGSMIHPSKRSTEQRRLREFLDGRSFPYFLREMRAHTQYPDAYHPIDYPLHANSGCPHAPDRDEYLRRPQDVFLSWGLSHPWRAPLSEVIRSLPIRGAVVVVDVNGVPRMRQHDYFASMRNAKSTVSFDGYGSSSFRVHESLVRCLLFLGPLSIRQRQPLLDGVHCMHYHANGEGDTMQWTNLGEKIMATLADPDRCFALYEAGYHHCMQHYTEVATARYVLSVVSQHDWSLPTPLSL